MAAIIFSNSYWIKVSIALGVLVTVAFEAKGGYFSRFRRFSLPYAVRVRFFYPVIFLILLVFAWDENILRFLQSLNSPAIALIASAGRFLGKRMLVILVALYVFSAVLRRLGIYPTIRGMLFASALAGLLITLFKFTFLRARPYTGLGPCSFFNPAGIMHDHGFQSFPSGDVAVVAGAFGYLFWVLKNKYLRLLCVLTVLSTALSRIQRNSHWPSDTLAAFAVGFTVAWWIKQQEPHKL